MLPLYDPIRLAEDLAVLDLVSDGRVDVVVGAGYLPHELAMFGHEMGDRIRARRGGRSVCSARRGPARRSSTAAAPSA